MTVPTLYVWSTGDEAFGRKAAEDTAGCVLGPYTFEVLENVSHWIPEMAPVELSDLLIRHLSRSLTSSPRRLDGHRARSARMGA